jgi:hypothetical protein
MAEGESGDMGIVAFYGRLIRGNFFERMGPLSSGPAQEAFLGRKREIPMGRT